MSTTMENESNKVQQEQVAWTILQHQCVPSFDTTPQIVSEASVDCGTEEIRVHVLDEFDKFEPTITTNEEQIVNEMLKDLIGQNDEFMDDGEDFDILNYVEANDSGKTNILDNSNFGVEDSYKHAQLSPKLQRIHHEMEPQVEDATMDINNRLQTDIDINGILDLTNRIQVVQEAEYLTTVYSTPSSLPKNDIVESMVYSKDIREETNGGECHDNLNRKNLEENDDVGGRNNTENFESVNTLDGRENESIQSSEIQSKRNVAHPLFKIRHKVQRRKRIHSDAKPHLCKVCDKSFTRKTSLLSHSIIHTGERPYVCETCNKSFRLKQALKDHSNIHKDERHYTCGICDKSFRQRTSLWHHSQTHNGERPYACETCNKSFRRISELNDHSNIHKDERPYKCGICDKSFRQRTCLWHHSKTHNDGKPYTCGICDKSFRQSASLWTHSKLHSDEKPYTCGICDKSFRQKGSLFSHSKTHNGEKPFVCNVCRKGFNRNSHLVSHSYIHTGKSPHQCKVCGKSFAQRRNLTKHSKLHTDKKLD